MSKLKNIAPGEAFTMTYLVTEKMAAKITNTLNRDHCTFEVADNDDAYAKKKITVQVTIDNARSINNQIQNLML